LLLKASVADILAVCPNLDVPGSVLTNGWLTLLLDLFRAITSIDRAQ